MSRSLGPLARALGLCLALACELPISFEIITLERVRAVLVDPAITLVDVVDDGVDPPGALPGGLRWRVSPGDLELPARLSHEGGVLVIGSDLGVAQRSAAALARAGNHPVYVFIPRDAAERSTLYALAEQ